MDDREILDLIRKAKADGRTKLDLSQEGLTSGPPELGQLTNLTTLGLNSNQLTRKQWRKQWGRILNINSPYHAD